MGSRINTIMQTCFFAISGVLPREEAIAAIKRAIQKTYGKRGEAVVQKNFAAVDASIAQLHEVKVPRAGEQPLRYPAARAGDRSGIRSQRSRRNDFRQRRFASGQRVAARRHVSHRHFALGKEKHRAADSRLGRRSVHPMRKMRAGLPARRDPRKSLRLRPDCRRARGIQISGAALARFCRPCATHSRSHRKIAPAAACASKICPAKSKSEAKHKAINMADQPPAARSRRARIGIFSCRIPEFDRDRLSHTQVKDVQLLEPLFEFSGACAGCGETPYIKLLTQLFGDRALIANATGCSSIYGGNLPTTPYTSNAAGRGPSWSNSLFEDNAEFGLGMRLAVDKQADYAAELLRRMAGQIGAVPGRARS